jgi:4-hydroxy-tetrahydrodipicolinate reductase
LEAYPDRETLNFGDCERTIEDDEITVVSTRVGHEPGTHTVLFDSPVDGLEFTHRVRDPKIFARGAIESAHWVRDQESGLYSIRDRL